jgi:hypothetical protein
MNQDELKIRIKMCKYCIEVLEKEKDDSRQPDALFHYKAQLVELESKLDSINRPPDIVIGLKPATLLGKVPK